MAGSKAVSLVAPGSGWTSLGYLPLPGGVRGVDGKADLNLRDLALRQDGSLRVIFYSVTQSQQSPITRVEAGVLKDRSYATDKVAEDVTGIIGDQ